MDLDTLTQLLISDGTLNDNFVTLKEDTGDAFIAEIIALYISDSRDVIASLKALVLGKSRGDNSNESSGDEGSDAEARPDFDAIARLAHRFKGSSLNLGVARVSCLCTELRSLCAEENGVQLREAVRKIEDESKRSERALQEYLDPHKKLTSHDAT